MKVKLINKPKRGDYDNLFTYGKEYQVIADYRNRKSGQVVKDDGLVIFDNTGQEQMIFLNEFEMIDDGKTCYTFHEATT